MVRYSLLGANLLMLVAVIGFVVKSPSSSKAVRQSSVLTSASDVSATPLDQVSSADIAVNVSRLTNLYEAPSVTNNADSINAQLAVSSSSNTVVSKPQVVSTTLKSIKDLHKYTTVPGDTVSKLAAKFGITSDTIRWSNGLAGDALSPGLNLWISPLANSIVYTVKAGDTADNLARQYRSNKDAIIAFNDAEVSGLKPGQVIVIPDGSRTAVVTATAASYTSGFAWGSAAIYNYNGYDYGWCTWYVSNRRTQIGRPVPSNLGNAYSWYRVAAGAGLPTGLSPQIGAVAVNEGGNHVSVVEAVNPDGSFWVSEMNSRGQVSMTNPAPAGGWGRVDYKLYSSPGNLKFIY
jgi:surface antigen